MSSPFEHDFLISYAHIDDQALVDGQSGWVSQLHRLLEIRVGQLMGQTPKIWRDPKLQGNDFFADTILDRLPKIAASKRCGVRQRGWGEIFGLPEFLLRHSGAARGQSPTLAIPAPVLRTIPE